MDELDNPWLHQWLSGCRFLMATSPQDGIDMIDLRSGFGAMRFREGWNRAGDNFILIRPPSEGPSLTTRTEPPPGTDVHLVPPGPSLLHSHYWNVVMAGLVDKLVADGGAGAWAGERIEKVMRQIADAHLMLSGPDSKGALFDIARPYLGRLREARAGTRSGDIPIGDFLAPASDVVTAYMRFELPGRFASEILALVLSVQANLPELGPPEATSPRARAAAIEHLVATTSRLVGQRAHLKVTPYAECSYLANLYVLTATILLGHGMEAGGLPAERLQELRGLVFTAEERRAHTIMPAIEAGTMVPGGLGIHLLETAKQGGPSLRDLCREYAVHPALRQVLLSCQTRGVWDRESILREYQESASAFDDHDVTSSLQGDYSPVAEMNREKAFLDLTALALGSQIGP